MDGDMTKAQFPSEVRRERGRWDAALAQVGRARMTERSARNEWTVEDIIAHVT